MWKALIKLVSKWAHRCEHNWEVMNDTTIYNNGKSRLPTGRDVTYVCNKCPKSKRIKIRY